MLVEFGWVEHVAGLLLESLILEKTHVVLGQRESRGVVYKELRPVFLDSPEGSH